MTRRPPRSPLFPYPPLSRSLKPVFDRRYGSVTAANSSPLTDGASAVLLMSDEAARALGYEPITFIRSYAVRSEEHTSELQSQSNLVCRLLLEKKKQVD